MSTNNLYLQKLDITLNDWNDRIKEAFEKQRKNNEIDVSNKHLSELEKIEQKEFKKYTEAYSPFPFFLYAYKNGVSDIAIIGRVDWDSEVQMKIDWIWATEFTFHRDKHILYVNAIKNWLEKWSWNIKPENQRIPQDWKWVLHILKKNDKGEIELEKTIQLRIATAPQHIKDSKGNPLETVVIRLLGWSKIIWLENGWFNKFDYQKIISLKHLKKGLILISWPTGSGKSTTLFSFIKQLNDWTKRIYTLENPVEIDVPWISQFDVQPKEDIPDDDEITFNFERGKKFLMRWAWDVILIWEIRDYTTAISAVQMADTWHITLATLHTNSAIGTISRYLWFESWGKNSRTIEKTTLVELLKYVSAQMLPPKLCHHCKRKVKDIRKEIETLEKEKKELNTLQLTYKEMLKELDVQKEIIIREFTRNNIKKIFWNIWKEKVELLIENSYLQNLKGCEKCTINPHKDKIHPRSWYKGVQLINETVIFDNAITKEILKPDFSKEKLLSYLVDKRPLLPKEDRYAIKEDKQHFFTMYQDALFKALLPKSALDKVMNNQEHSHLISLLEAKEHWYVEI